MLKLWLVFVLRPQPWGFDKGESYICLQDFYVMILSFFMSFASMSKGPDIFGSVAGTQVDDFLSVITWEGVFSSQYWKGHNF